MAIRRVPVLLSVVIVCAFTVSAATFSADSATLSYSSSGIETFSFSGPGFSATGFSIGAPDLPLGIVRLNSPIFLIFEVVSTPASGGLATGAGTLGGTAYSFLGFADLGNIFMPGPFTLTQGNLAPAVPYTLTGEIATILCSVGSPCSYSGNYTDFIQIYLPGLVSISASPFPFFGDEYVVTSAQFTSVPEAATWVVLTSGLCALGVARPFQKVIRSQEKVLRISA